MEEEKYLDWEGQEQIWHVKSFPYHDFVVYFWGYNKLKTSKQIKKPRLI